MRRSVLLLVVAFVAVLVMSACQSGQFVCQDEWGCVTYRPGEPVHLASVLVISGSNEGLGLDSQRGVEIAIIDKGEILGHKIKHTAADGKCSGEGGLEAAASIVADPTILAVVGHSCSSSCGPAAPIYAEAGLTIISPSCTAPSLTLVDRAETFFRSCHNDSVQGLFAAEFFFDQMGLRTAATIHDGSAYAEQLAAEFAKNFRAKGGTVTIELSVKEGDTDMGPVLTAIAANPPQLIYYPIFIAEGAAISQQAREMPELDNTILAGADGMISPDFLDAAGPAAEGMYFTGPDLNFANELYDHFNQVYQREYGTAPIVVFHAHAYDATNILFAAIERTAVQERDGTLHIGRRALRDAVAATQDFAGITGNLNCDANGDCADPRINISQIQNREYLVVWKP